MKGFETTKKKLGFGAMRLPMLNDNEADMPQIEQMVDYFLEKGFTYFDTAFTYLGGTSEEILGKALVARHPRETYTIATKTPMFKPIPQSELYKRLDVQLKRLGTDYIDYYLLHNIVAERVNVFKDNGAWEFLSDVKEKGYVKHIGFSFHDKADLLDELLTEHPEVDFVQLQINYADWLSDKIQSKANYEVAVKHGKPVIVMEPIKGGSLASMPEAVTDVFKKANPDMNSPEWALRYAESLDNVAVVLSGMSTIGQLKDNVGRMSDERKLTDEEYAAIDEVIAILNSIPTVPCTSCNYCGEVCPMGIMIPRMLQAYNECQLYGNQGGRNTFRFASARGAHPNECIECRACESNCPQHIEITKYLKEVASIYENIE